MSPRVLAESNPDQSPARRTELAADGCVRVAEAVTFLGLRQAELYRLKDAGKVAYAKCGRRRLVSRRSVTEFVASRLVEG